MQCNSFVAVYKYLSGKDIRLSCRRRRCWVVELLLTSVFLFFTSWEKPMKPVLTFTYSFHLFQGRPRSWCPFDLCCQLCIRYIIIGFEILAAVVMKRSVLWDIMSRSTLEINRRLGKTYLLHLQGWRKSQARSQTFMTPFLLDFLFDPEDPEAIYTYLPSLWGICTELKYTTTGKVIETVFLCCSLYCCTFTSFLLSAFLIRFSHKKIKLFLCLNN
jgi:hypothetical protein